MNHKTAYITIFFLVMAMCWSSAWAGGLDGEGTFTGPESGCGEYFWVFVQSTHVDTPKILDAWTTKYPYSSPGEECYEFVRHVDTLAFVVEYYHIGGQIPYQYGQAYDCGDDESKKVCIFPWTVSAPPGIYWLINYYDDCHFNEGNFDWAAKVGNVVFGYPDPYYKRPLCFKIIEAE
jgi:hypothetical protein